MKQEDVLKLSLGLYHIFWKNEEGESLAAVGMCENGDRWIAPINWIAPSLNEEAWEEVERVEQIKVEKITEVINRIERKGW